MTGIISDNVGRTSGLIKAASGGGGGVWTLIKTLTASADSDLSFVDGTDDVTLDSTYPIYRFSFINMHPESSTELQFQTSIDGGSNYNVTLTSTYFYCYHTEDDGSTGLTYYTGGDQAQGTSFQRISRLHNDNDSSTSGYLHLFNPSSTTFVKHFIIRTNSSHSADYTNEWFVAGYCNTTTAIDGVQFSFASGTIDAGDICLYGITT